MRHLRCCLQRAFVLALILAPASRPLHAVDVRFDDPALHDAARGLAVGGLLRIDGLRLEEDRPPEGVELERFSVFAPEARIVVRSTDTAEETSPPDTAYFRGRLTADPSSLAIVSVTAAGALRGWITSESSWYELSAAGRGPIEVTEVDLARDAGASGLCAAGSLDALPAGIRQLSAPPAQPGRARTGGVQYAVDLAIDTDWELFQLFGSAQAATTYIADLVAAASAIYARDIGTQLQLGLLILWDSPADPWTVEGDLLEALYELGDHWHANHAGTERTLAHLVSGKTSLGGGIAYGGVLCSPDILVNGHWAGGYGVTGALASNTEFRDIFVFSHELGHNFDSRHTHCYNGTPLPGDPEIDQCRTGETTGSGHVCYAGSESTPPGGGSIMSYCHLQPGGYGNINLWLGREGFYGVRSERVPEKMLQHVEEVAACLPPPADLFADGFESGDTSRWSTTIP